MTEKLPKASLIYREENELKHVVLLVQEKVRFGRDHTNDIRLALFPIQELVFQLATTDISRQHFEISRTPEGYRIQDLSSTNGTSVDCVAVIHNPRILKQNEVIDIGGVLDLKVYLKGESLWLKRLTNTPQESYFLFPGEVTLGSSESDSLPLRGEGILPGHARIRFEGEKYFLSKSNADGKIDVEGVLLSQAGEEVVLEAEKHVTLGEMVLWFKLHQG